MNKIVDERREKEKYFGSLVIGDCFIYHDNIYMKTRDGGGECAINLESGMLSDNLYGAKVTPVAATIHIDDIEERDI